MIESLEPLGDANMIHVLLGPAGFDDRIPDRDSCVYWHDDLSVGPVPLTETLEELSHIRQTFWRTPTPLSVLSAADTDRTTAEKGHRRESAAHVFSLAKRYEQIRRLGDSPEIV